MIDTTVITNISNQRKIDTKELTPGALYYIRGKVAFSHVSRKTTDEERERNNRRRNNSHPVDKNYTSITISDAYVVSVDPNRPTIEDVYAYQHMYVPAKSTNQSPNFTAINKSKNLPKIAVVDETNSRNYKQIIIDKELATGLDVTLVMRVFAAQANKGVSLDSVLVNEPIRFYEGGNSLASSLSEMGITFEAIAPNTAPYTEAPAPAPAPYNAPVTNNTMPMNGVNTTVPVQPMNMGVPAPAPVPAPMPSSNNFANATPYQMNGQPMDNQPMYAPNQQFVNPQTTAQMPAPAPVASDNPFSSYTSPVTPPSSNNNNNNGDGGQNPGGFGPGTRSY